MSCDENRCDSRKFDQDPSRASSFSAPHLVWLCGTPQSDQARCLNLRSFCVGISEIHYTSQPLSQRRVKDVTRNTGTLPASFVNIHRGLHLFHHLSLVVVYQVWPLEFHVSACSKYLYVPSIFIFQVSVCSKYLFLPSICSFLYFLYSSNFKWMLGSKT